MSRPASAPTMSMLNPTAVVIAVKPSCASGSGVGRGPCGECKAVADSALAPEYTERASMSMNVSASSRSRGLPSANCER